MIVVNPSGGFDVCWVNIISYTLFNIPQDDEMVLKGTVNGRAEAIVSFNHKDYGDVPATFGIALLTPAQAIRSFRHE